MSKVGDIITFEATGDLAPGISCVVVEVSPDDGRILKVKAVTPDERLGRMGFIESNGDYYAVEWQITKN